MDRLRQLFLSGDCLVGWDGGYILLLLRVGPLKAVVKLFKVRKIGAKLIFFSQISTPRINDTKSRRRHGGFFQKVFRRGRGCLHILSFFLSACCGTGDRNESTNVSISKLIIGTKPKRFDLVRLLSEQKQNVSICSKII